MSFSCWDLRWNWRADPRYKESAKWRNESSIQVWNYISRRQMIHAIFPKISSKTSHQASFSHCFHKYLTFVSPNNNSFFSITHQLTHNFSFLEKYFIHTPSTFFGDIPKGLLSCSSSPLSLWVSQYQDKSTSALHVSYWESVSCYNQMSDFNVKVTITH